MRLIDADVLTVICKVREYDLFLKNATPESWAKAYAAFREEIDRIPTIEAEPVRHGKWINHGSFVTCSVCNEEQYGIDTGRFYCQNCGAKMDMGIDYATD